MDTSEMRELLHGYLSEMDWSGETTKNDIMNHLADRDEALRTMVNEYVALGTYHNPEEVLTLIPVQAWQDVQGDEWRGAESQYVEDVSSNYQGGPLGQDQSDVGQPGGSPPRTPGFGQSAGAAGGNESPADNSGSGDQPRGGMPGDGAGRIENPGTQDSGVWPVSGPASGNPDATIHDMASFGQGERGSAGYADSGDSEVYTIPPGSPSGAGGQTSGGVEGDASSGTSATGSAGANTGEVDPGVGGSGETTGETPIRTGGAGFGNAVGGGSQGDAPRTADKPSKGS